MTGLVLGLGGWLWEGGVGREVGTSSTSYVNGRMAHGS